MNSLKHFLLFSAFLVFGTSCCQNDAAPEGQNASTHRSSERDIASETSVAEGALIGETPILLPSFDSPLLRKKEILFDEDRFYKDMEERNRYYQSQRDGLKEDSTGGLDITFDCEKTHKRGFLNVKVNVLNKKILPFLLGKWQSDSVAYNFKCHLKNLKTGKITEIYGRTANGQNAAGWRGNEHAFWNEKKATYDCEYYLKVPAGSYEIKMGLQEFSIWSPQRTQIEVLGNEIDESIYAYHGKGMTPVYPKVTECEMSAE